MSDPWESFVRLAEGRDYVGYFETAGSGGRTGSAVSFVRPDAVVELRRGSDGGERLRTIDRFLRAERRGTAIGFLGFDSVGLFEPALRPVPTGDPFPLGMFALVRSPERARVPPRPRRPAPPFARVGRPLDDSLPVRRYGRSVRRLVEEIRNGEAYQIVLAHRRTWARPADLLERAGLLRASERFAFFYYLRLGDVEIVGASPESVVELRAGRAFVNPIAGTIPRGAGRSGRRPLAVDPKELAEHRMLVDLARNDLGTVAVPGTVRLTSRERIERYARLSHLVSRVAARVRPGVSRWAVLGAAFPAGTVSGAPKIRATQLLRREEASWRGPYAGTVGVIGPGARASWALAIRTAFARGPRLYTAAGAGIVQYSEPRREFDETRIKLAQVEAALVGGAA